MRTLRLSPGAYRRVTLAALIALGVIVVTGAAVRLTGSGLGCPQWPNCDAGHLAPHGTTGYHGVVEYVNRLFTGLVSVLVILAVLGSLVRQPRRRDLTWLSVGLVAGVLAQIVLGGLSVIFELSPPWVMAHFIVSMVLVADAVVLHHRSGMPDGPQLPVVSNRVRVMGAVLVGLAGLVIFAGTVVTGTGPHGGDEDVRRLGFSITSVARVHGVLANAFIAAVLLTLFWLNRDGAPPAVRRRAEVLMAVLIGQAVVGYVQYLNGVPIGLVAVHIVGVLGVWIATLQFLLALREVVPERVRDRQLVQLPA